MFTKDPQADYKEMFKEEYPEAKVWLPSLAWERDPNGLGDPKVISLTKLKKRFATYESRRKLVASYDLFFADEKIKALLPPLIGTEFFARKKYAAPFL